MMTASTAATLLIEILTEELPPKALAKLADTFSQLVTAELVKMGFTSSQQAETFATPRRLALTLPDVLSCQPVQQIERRGPAVANAFQQGKPTAALLGFAKSCGVDHTQLQTGSDGKQDVFIFRSTQAGVTLQGVLPGIIETALKKLPAPKMMRWGARVGQFIRPIHRVVIYHGAQCLAGAVFGLQSNRCTQGHRFLQPVDITIDNADRYAKQLYDQGNVIASFAMRRQYIEQALQQHAQQYQATLAPAPGLLDEVTALVEWPTVYAATFAEDFLAVPQECLILSMQQHQRYFALLDARGKLMPTFLLVANIAPTDPTYIIQGNERVLRARLADAQFFYHQDQKHPLASRVPQLAEVVYHNQLGSQLARVNRLQYLSGQIAQQLGADQADAERAAYLAKADLMTDMVNEFPELQGVMGKYYAQHDGESAVVAEAIASHYQPRFAGDALPEGAIAQSVALADKLETLVGIYGIGLIPNGDKDPFALRRAALGVIRLLLILPLDLVSLLTAAEQSFAAHPLSANVVDAVYGFIRERVKHYLGQHYPLTHIEAVLSRATGRLDQLIPRLAAIAEFLHLPQAQALIVANKRIQHILKKYPNVLPTLEESHFTEPAERQLFSALTTVTPTVEHALNQQDYPAALKAQAVLHEPVDHFFAQVMVMTDVQVTRENRLALLAAVSALMNRIADLSLLTEG